METKTDLPKMFYKYGRQLYDAFLYKAETITVPEEFTEIAKKVCRKIGWNPRIIGERYDFKIADFPDNRKTLIALSGGLDSTYLLHKLKDAGDEVIAVHVEGLNKSSAHIEAEHAAKLANLAGVPFIRVKFHAPAQTFPDNPFKNQLVLAIMLMIGAGRGVYRYGVGSDWTTTLAASVTGFTVTDSADVYRAFWAGVEKHFPQAELVFIPDRERKGERLEYLFRNHRATLENVSSCIAPQRFRKHLHEENAKKYNVPLMKDRCGSCYKCAMEYLLLAYNGLIPTDGRFEAHCWKTLATSKTAHRPDLFALSLPLQKRIENLKSYGS